MLKVNNITNKFFIIVIGGLKKLVRRLDIDKTDNSIRDFLKSLKVDKDQYIFESGGKPIGALVSLDILNWWKEREESFKVYDEIWEDNKKVSAREVKKDVAEVVRVVRSKKQ